MSGLGDKFAFPLPVAGDHANGLYTTIEVVPGREANGGMTYRQYLIARVLPGIAADSGLTPEEGFALAASWVDTWIAALEVPAALPGLAPDPGLTPTNSALDLECPYCHAAPGEPCRTPSGAALPASFHIARVPTLYGTAPKSEE